MPGKIKHGLSKHLLYSKWAGMKQRCYNENNNNYKYYGGRIIIVCDEWLNDCKAYCDYVISLPDCLKKSYTIDRIDNDGNYEEGNLRWADKYTQASNRRVGGKHKYVGTYAYRNKYYSQIQFNEHKTHFGPFGTEKEAAKARDLFIMDKGINPINLQVFRKK